MKPKTENTIIIPAQYRQGDVMLERVEQSPAGLNKMARVARVAGKIVLAQGKGAGRAHVIADPGSEMLADATGNRYVKIDGVRLKARLPLIDEHMGLVVNYPKIGVVKFNPDDVIQTTRAGKVTVVIDGYFALLQHDCTVPDHATIALPRGLLRNVRQRELQNGDSRNVID